MAPDGHSRLLTPHHKFEIVQEFVTASKGAKSMMLARRNSASIIMQSSTTFASDTPHAIRFASQITHSSGLRYFVRKKASTIPY